MNHNAAHVSTSQYETFAFLGVRSLMNVFLSSRNLAAATRAIGDLKIAWYRNFQNII